MSNVFSFTGTLGRDAEQRFTASGQAILNLNVACNVGYGDKRQTMWIRVARFGKQAEGSFIDYLKKGQQVFISGELSQREYEQDGVKRTSLELNANVIDLVGGQQPRQSTQQRPSQAAAPSYDDFDDVPFADMPKLLAKHHLI
jgi:single-strand DNA-binding protein